MPDMKEKEYYTAKETAVSLGINMARLARLRRQGRIKSIVPDSDPRYAIYHIDEIRKADTSDLRKSNAHRWHASDSEALQAVS